MWGEDICLWKVFLIIQEELQRSKPQRRNTNLISVFASFYIKHMQHLHANVDKTISFKFQNWRRILKHFLHIAPALKSRLTLWLFLKLLFSVSVSVCVCIWERRFKCSILELFCSTYTSTCLPCLFQLLHFSKHTAFFFVTLSMLR